MSRKQANNKPAVSVVGGQRFFRPTITIPGELEEFAYSQAGSSQHAGNFSSYVRSLIIADKAQKDEQENKAVKKKQPLTA